MHVFDIFFIVVAVHTNERKNRHKGEGIGPVLVFRWHKRRLMRRTKHTHTHTHTRQEMGRKKYRMYRMHVYKRIVCCCCCCVRKTMGWRVPMINNNNNMSYIGQNVHLICISTLIKR